MVVGERRVGVREPSRRTWLPPLALWSMPPDKRRSLWANVEPRPADDGYGRLGRLGRLGYETEAELWREDGDRPAEEAVGEWPEVYDRLLEGGVTAGVLDDALMGDMTWAAETPYGSGAAGRVT